MVGWLGEGHASSQNDPIQIRKKSRKANNKKLAHTEIIKGMMICLWDNVSGPRTEQVWEGEEELSPDMLKYICRYTLGGEITHSSGGTDEESNPCGGLQAKFHMLPQYGKWRRCYLSCRY